MKNLLPTPSEDFTRAYSKSKATDPVLHLAAENQGLGVVKALRKPTLTLDLSPYPLLEGGAIFLNCQE